MTAELYRKSLKCLSKGAFSESFRLCEGSLALDPENADAMHTLGELLREGKGCVKDLSRAISLWEAASARGCNIATYNLGCMFNEGLEVSRDARKAAAYFASAAAAGDGDAACNLGKFYDRGDGVQQNFAKAALFYALAIKNACESDQSARRDAAHCLSIYYQEGKGLPQNSTKAFSYAMIAAEEGQMDAVYNVACHYHRGDGVAKNHDKAVQFYRRGAAADHVEATYNLGCMYMKGEGVTQDTITGLQLLEKAANAGHTCALDALRNLSASTGDDKNSNTVEEATENKLTTQHLTIADHDAHASVTLHPGASVEIMGLQSAAGLEMNGCEGHCLHFNEGTKRWGVLLTDGRSKWIRAQNLRMLKPKRHGDQASADADGNDIDQSSGSEEVVFHGCDGVKEQSAELRPGACVHIHGLRESGAAMNGLEGHCLSLIAATGRWGVLLADGTSKAIKADNLRPVPFELQEEEGLRPGMVAEIHGLTSVEGVSLNGCECRCLALTRGADRWRILMSDGSSKAVRTCNLKVVGPEPDDRLVEAKRLYTMALYKSPLDSALWNNRAALNLRLRCPHYAAADAIRAININSTCSSANFTLGCAFFEMAGYKHAISYLQKCAQGESWRNVSRKLADAQLKLSQGLSLVQRNQQPPGRYKSHFHPQRTLRYDTDQEALAALNAILQKKASVRSVEVKTAPSHGGLGLYTTEDCGMGVELLAETPIMTICYDPKLCILCAKRLTRSCVECSCGAEQYCNEECREEAWNLYHRVQCGKIARGIAELRAQLHMHTQMGMGTIAQSCHPLGALRIAGMVRSSEAYPCDIDAVPALRNISRLTDNAEEAILKEIQHPFKNRYSQWKMIETALSLDTVGYVTFDFEFYDNVWHLLTGNLIGGSSNDSAVLMRSGTFANHRCTPNAEVMFSCGEVKLKAYRPLRKQEQVFISYVDNRLPQQEVHKALRKNYWFTCKCRRCVK